MKKIIIIFTIFLSLNLSFLIKIKAESFIWPSDGYLGWRFYQDTNGGDPSGIGGTYHTGVDIWSNPDGGWNGGVQGNSNAIYSAYPGTVFYTDYLGLQIKHRDGLYTNYWHVRNRSVNTGNYVDTNTLIGYQNDYQPYSNVVHVHVTVTTAPMQRSNHDRTGASDPSSYFGVPLDVRQNNVVPWGYHVTHGNSLGCGSANITINKNISGNVDCSATNSITILPESNLTGEQHYYIH